MVSNPLNFLQSKKTKFISSLIKNKYVPTCTVNIYPSTNEFLGLSRVEQTLHTFSMYSNHIDTSGPAFEYIDKLSICCSTKCDISYFSKPERRCCVLYNADHKDNYLKYYIIFERKSRQIIINTYIGGNSSHCTLENFHNIVNDTFYSAGIYDHLPIDPPTMYQTDYINEIDEELDFYRIVNAHLRFIFSQMHRMVNCEFWNEFDNR